MIQTINSYFLKLAYSPLVVVTMIPMIQQELLKGSYLNAEIIEFIELRSNSSPFAVNIATFTGVHVFSEYLNCSILTGFTITLGLILPSFIIILLIAMFLVKSLKINMFIML